jgi:hypothetical protein
MMVIQSKMSPKAIVEVWEKTESVFRKYNISLSTKTLDALVTDDVLTSILKDLNDIVGSSSITCIEGG